MDAWSALHETNIFKKDVESEMRQKSEYFAEPRGANSEV
jgi:hypothetical protein